MELFRFAGFLGAIWFAALLPSIARAQVHEISEVTVRGNQRVDSTAMLMQLKHKRGKITQEEISADVQNLYETGFFDQVSAGIVPGADGKAVLRYTVTEKPVVRKIYIKGNEEVKEEDLAGILALDARRFMDRGKVQAIIKQAVTLYQSKGFHEAAIEYSVLPVGENQVDLTFNVQEGPRYKIRSVELTGLETLSESDILKTIQTKRYKWWNSWVFGTGRLNQEMLENDRSLIRQYLLDQGLVDGTVSEASVQKREDGFYVSFAVSEGSPYDIGVLKASGDLINGSETETLSGIESAPGKRFNASSVREDAFKISEKFSNIGYAYVNVVPATSVNRQDKKVDIVFATSKGSLVEVRRINIQGNEKTYDHVIRRELKVEEQQVYSGKKVKRSEELLQRLGYFEEAHITSEPVSAEQVDLNVNVREGSTGAFSAGAGYSTSDGLLFNTRLSENNIFGTGRRAVLDLNFGTERDSYVLSFDDRRLADTHLAGGVDIVRTDREFSDFERRLTGGGLSLGYPLEEVLGEWAEDISAGAKYEYSNIDIHDVTEDAAEFVKESEGKSNASGITPRLVRNTINNPLNPTRGSRQEISVELAGLGGDQNFYLFEAQHTMYEPLLQGSYGDITFSWRSRLGYGESYNDDRLPLYRRYFPGGMNSVRGYKARSLGPQDAGGHEYGGSKEFINNLELIFPLINSAGVKFVTFYDLGEAYDDNQAIDLGELKKAYGVGLRWSSPIGPIRIEFGFPVDKREGDKSMITLFSFGAPL